MLVNAIFLKVIIHITIIITFTNSLNFNNPEKGIF